MTVSKPSTMAFNEFGLPQALLQSLSELGYESPSPIQAASIPALLGGRDLLGQAQTGTGKTAAFALPLLTNIDQNDNTPQLLVLTPTRELAIQVAEACQRYSRYMNLRVLPIYGGQSYSNQLRQLKQGVHIVVGTPGRIMDHMNRGTLKLGQLQALVLDEADEMLRMGFIDDVEWILERTPHERQIALFSATMPREIKKVADTYLTEPEHIKIQSKTTTASTIRQRYIMINQQQKLDALTRCLEVEEYDGIIIFVRTKIATVELTDKLSARGYRAIALNGDIQQNQREQIVEKFKRSRYDIMVATDVVARGLDIERISHVVNYDIPLDTESYVHRIGRTGRAGRTGEAILFVTPREKRLLKAIEKVTQSAIQPMSVPSADTITEKRITHVKQQILHTITQQDLSRYQQLITEFQHESDHDPAVIAAALAYMNQGNKSLFESEISFEISKEQRDGRRRSRSERDREAGHHRKSKDDRKYREKRKKSTIVDGNMERYRIEIGHDDGVKPGNIVGAIANEADLSSRYIGHINIQANHSVIDLPKDMPKAVFKKLQKAYVCGKQMNIRKVDS